MVQLCKMKSRIRTGKWFAVGLIVLLFRFEGIYAFTMKNFLTGKQKDACALVRCYAKPVRRYSKVSGMQSKYVPSDPVHNDNGRQFSFLLSLDSPQEVNRWMHDFVSGRNVTQSIDFSSLTTLEQSDFIRRLRDLGAFEAIITFTNSSLPASNIFVYTDAIICLAASSEYRREAIQILDLMVERGITPSPFTITALFQAATGAEQASKLLKRLTESYPSIKWTRPVFDAAINACARGKRPSWTVASRFVKEMLSRGLQPSNDIYHALFQICLSNGNISRAKELTQQILIENPQLMSPRLWAMALHTCTIAGNATEALSFLRIMQDNGTTPNAIHCTSFLQALSYNHEGDRACRFLYHMAGIEDHSEFHGLRVDKPDMVAIQTVLKACASAENYALAKRILDDLKAGRFGDTLQLNEVCYNIALAACTEPSQAIALVREMRLTRRYRFGAIPPSPVTYTRAITVCRKARDIESAFYLLDRARNDGITPDVYMYSAAIWTAARAGDVAHARFLFESMLLDGCIPTIVSYNGLLAAYAFEGEVMEAISLYDEIRQNSLIPQRATFYHLSRALKKTVDVVSRSSSLKSIYDTMSVQERSAMVGGPIIEALILAYAAIGDYQSAVHVYDAIEGPSDATCLRAILYACSVSSPPQWEDALDILHTSDITHDNISPHHVDSIALANAMIACSKAGRWQESLQLLRLYGDENTPLYAINSLIASCGRGGRPDIALEVLNTMEKDYRLIPDSASYRSAIIACNQAEHAVRRARKLGQLTRAKEPSGLFSWWECAMSLLRRMKENNVQVDIQTYSSSISACEAAGQWQRALAILQSMMDEEDEKGVNCLNLYCFNAAISACEKGDAWVEALEIYERMKAEGRALSPNEVTLGSLILALDKAGQKELALAKYEEGIRRKIIKPWKATLNDRNERIFALDLHTFSGAMAKAAVRSHLESLLEGQRQVKGDLIIITGKGLRSEATPILSSTVARLLENEYSIEATINERNTGRIVLSAEVLKVFVEAKKWR